MVWAASRLLTMGSAALRLVRAVLPVASLRVGKLIIDEVVRLSALPSPPDSLASWWSSGEATLLAAYVLVELALAILSDLLGRHCQRKQAEAALIALPRFFLGIGLVDLSSEPRRMTGGKPTERG